MSPYQLDRLTKDFATGLRGKNREKMLFAIQQAVLNYDHTHAHFEDHVRTIKPTLDKLGNEATSEILKIAAKLRDDLVLLFGHYTLAKFHHETRATNAADYAVQDASYCVESDAQKELRMALHDFRQALEVPGVPKKTSSLTDEDRAAIIERINTVKALPAGTIQTTNAKGEIEVS